MPASVKLAAVAVASRRVGASDGFSAALEARAVRGNDDPIDDFQGALDAGCRAILLDRGQTQAFGRIIPTLDCLEGALACC